MQARHTLSQLPAPPFTPPGAKPPSRLHTLLEWRVLLELGTLPISWPWLQNTPRGDGHPVLLLPGFAAGDGTLRPLAAFLRSRGYAVETWGFGQNRGFNRKFVVALEQKLRYIHHRAGRKVSVIGHSLGGVFAYDLAHRAPECVRGVFSLGSPMRLSPVHVEAPLTVKVLYRLLAHPMGPVAHMAMSRARLLETPPEVPSACIFSATDGVVPAHAAVIDAGSAQHENVPVPGSHLGLGINPLVLWILADRLSQAEGRWKPFRPKGSFARLYKSLLPRPPRAR
jgi:pimeloyl-ACP methyl ester carboxylesterase